MLYSSFDKHLLAIDCVIFGFDNNELRLLLIKRKFKPAKGKLSLMGGFLNKNETTDEAANRILKNLTGLENVYMKQLKTFSDIKRDPGDRVLSIVYYALIKINDYDKKTVEENNAFWVPISDIPDLIFDHNYMVNSALKEIRNQALFKPIGFELLPSKFTIPQLQSLYEAIYLQKLDRGNFRKKMLSMNILKKLNEKYTKDSKKGAYYYVFDKKMYDNLQKEGFNFDLNKYMN